MCETDFPKKRRRSAGWAPFERWTDRYDQWFESEKGKHLFRIETACIRELLADAPRPWLEIGVGTGRFAEALRIDEGIDPSPSALAFAAKRGIKTRVGEGEHLDYENHRFGTVFLIVTICFLRHPARVLSECRRVLKPEGMLLIGLVPTNSSWGRLYRAKGEQGHPFYTPATFYTPDEIIGLCERAAFELVDSRSGLQEKAVCFDGTDKPAEPGLVSQAGFVGMKFKRATLHASTPSDALHRGSQPPPSPEERIPALSSDGAAGKKPGQPVC